MKYSLQDNARNSLQLAIEFFGYSEQFEHFMCLDKNEESNLKIALSFLENALELLLKLILSRQDPNCIYTKPTIEQINAARAIAEKDDSISYDEAMILIGNVKTITYSQAIDLYAIQYRANSKIKSVLKKIGYLRNAVTHLGINTEEEREQVEDYMSLGFGLILQVLYPQMKVADPYYNYNDVVDMVESFCCVPAQRPIHAIDTEKLFRHNLLEAIFSVRFQEFAKTNGFELDSDMTSEVLNGTGDGEFLYVEADNGEKYIGQFYTKYLLLENVTLIYEIEGLDIQFLYVHDTNEVIYIGPGKCCMFADFDDEDDAGEFKKYFEWFIDEETADCKKYPLSETNLIDVLQNMLLGLRAEN